MSNPNREFDKSCGSNDCDKKAQYRMFWPNNSPLNVCSSCKLRALGIAKVMGFHLHIEEIKINVESES